MQVRIAGKGGQGIVLAGLILGRALAVFEKKNVIQSQSYGAEARGGRCRADVIVSDGEIHDLVVTRPDILIIMSQEAMKEYSGLARRCKILILDKDRVRNVPKTKAEVYKIPATSIATRLKSAQVANLVMLGALASLTNVVSKEALEKSVKDCIPAKFVKINLEAMEKGYYLTK